jgi:hypothetical protein
MGAFPNLSDIQNSRARNAIFWGGSALLATGLAVVYHWNPETAGFFPGCAFRALTGYYCPGCGMTRALHQLLHGNIAAALSYNILVLGLPVLFYWGISQFVFIACGRSLPRIQVPDGLLWALLGLVIVFGVIRNFPFYPFTLLAPH